MIIFRYELAPAFHDSTRDDAFFRIEITDATKNNVTTWFHGKKYLHTIPQSELDKITDVVNTCPELLEIKTLEKNSILDGEEYNFTFSDGKRSNSFSGFNIREYSGGSHPKASMALKAARAVKEILEMNNIRTMIPRRLSKKPYHYGNVSGCIPL